MIKKNLHLTMVFISLVLFLVSMYIMRFYANNVTEHNSEKIIDLRMGYSYDEIVNYINQLDDNGKNYYVSRFHFVDTFYPIIYCIFYATILSYLIKKCFPKIKIIKMLLVLPIIGMICDLIENILLNHIVNNFDNFKENIVNISSVFTIVKFIMVYTSLTLSVLFLMVIIVKRSKIIWMKR